MTETLPKARRGCSSCLWGLLGFGLISIPGFFLLGGLVLLEKGMDDGPFYARDYHAPLPTRARDEEMALGDGYVQVFVGETSSPLLVVTDSSRRKKSAQVLDVTTNPDYAKYEFTSMTLHAAHDGMVRDSVVFVGRWSFGNEHGTLYLWPNGRVHRYYLSW